MKKDDLLWTMITSKGLEEAFQDAKGLAVHLVDVADPRLEDYELSRARRLTDAEISELAAEKDKARATQDQRAELRSSLERTYDDLKKVAEASWRVKSAARGLQECGMQEEASTLLSTQLKALDAKHEALSKEAEAEEIRLSKMSGWR